MFNSKNLDVFNAELTAALNVIAKKHNVNMTIGAITYNANQFTTKITCISLDSNVIEESVIKEHEGLKLGMKYSSGNKMFEIIEFKPNRPKNDVIILELKTDKRYKTSAMMARFSMGIKFNK